MKSKQYSEVVCSTDIWQVHYNEYINNQHVQCCLYICSLYELIKSMENDIEYSMNGYEYGFVKICQTNTSCNPITKYQNI